jgi:mannose/cellobiose epimerase-like protein (N-acyl-D-glucosamine 2-epimerase family)
MPMPIKRLLLCLLILSAAIAGPMPASAQQHGPAVDGLPSASAWKQHLERDILPFWQSPAALGDPVGNFPTSRCNDGSVANPQALCAEFQAAPDWIRSTVGRQYVRMVSRQAYLYGVAFHLTGDPRYLVWARAAVHYIVDHAVDNNTGAVTSYWEGGKAFADPADQTSQDLSYALVGLSFYYYLTRDPYVLQPILRIEHHIRQTYYDPHSGLYRWKLKGSDADRVELVAQLDQANAYMGLLAPILPQPYQARWRAELSQIARAMRARFYDAASTMFVGVDPQKGKGGCIYAHEDTDFGHTIKAYWMLYLTGRATHDGELTNFARDRMPGILRRAYLPATGSWATQPTCDTQSGGIDRTSTWWMAAELDQAALTLGIADPAVLAYIPKTYDFWLQHMVDHRYGEVWDEIALPGYAPRLPKVHLWKNGFHTAEHALVGYIATSAIRSEPVDLYYAFAGCKMPPAVEPYYYDGVVTSHTETPLPDMPGFCRAKVTFTRVH